MSKEIQLTPGGKGREKPPDQPWFIPNDEEQGVYRFIIAAARRARQLQVGARPTISTTSRKPTKIAMEEIRTGEIAVDLDPQPPEPLEEVEEADEELEDAEE
ncbi:MAG: DNA-directed RNA polymerase subunit omega [Bryobacterales bacterium]|nr:DNA-directed RNA polymerase subunit omega [Bryobacterales bacterium]